MATVKSPVRVRAVVEVTVQSSEAKSYDQAASPDLSR